MLIRSLHDRFAQQIPLEGAASLGDPLESRAEETVGVFEMSDKNHVSLVGSDSLLVPISRVPEFSDALAEDEGEASVGFEGGSDRLWFDGSVPGFDSGLETFRGDFAAVAQRYATHQQQLRRGRGRVLRARRVGQVP